MFKRSLETQEIEDDTSLLRYPWSWYPWVGLVAGVVVLGHLYYQASQMQVPYLFERFWLGMFLFFIPTFWRQLSSHISRIERLALLVIMALFSYVPKLFRCSYYFCYSDELTWWRGVQNLISGSPVLSNNPLGLVQGSFPGLPLITIVLQRASGLSTFQAGLILIGFVRLLSLFSIFLLGETIFHSSKVAAVAALVFMMNANFFYFSSQFSYESLSIPLILLTLLFVQHRLREPRGRVSKVWNLVIFINIAAIVLTHHISTYIMVAMFTVMTFSAIFLSHIKWLRSSPHLYNITLFGYITSLGWLTYVALDVIKYDGEPIIRGLDQITSHTVRTLFGGITLPLYEVISAYSASILIGLLALLGALLIVRQKKALYTAQVGLLSFGLLYFATAPLVLTSWGSEAGRRSWTYSFISLSLLSGFALTWLTKTISIGNLRIRALLGQVITTFALVLLLLGGVASSTSISYRFPGEYLLNADARSYTLEIIDAAKWMFNQTGPANRVLGDRTTEQIFGSYGLQEPALLGGPRPWDVFLPTSWTTDAIYWLEDAKSPFVVVDKRMAILPPQMDYRFQRGEPPSDYSNLPLPLKSIEKFDDISQLDRIYDSGNIRVYYLTNTNLHINKPSNGVVIQSPENTIDIGRDPYNLMIPNLLYIVLRSLLLIPLLLIMPGFIIGKKLVPNWSNLEIVIRMLLSVSISISLIILSTFIFALMISNVEKAVNITLLLFGLILIIGFIELILHLFSTFFNKQISLSNIQHFSDKVRLRDLKMAFLFGSISIVLIALLMGMIKPNNDPRTVFALDFSSVPNVQIVNHEAGGETYQLKGYTKSNKGWSSESIYLDKDQSVKFNIQQQSLLLPSQEKIYLDLYINGQATPYRSLSFMLETLPTLSQSILKEIQGN